ncbi:type II toxin-antitoxin system RelB/DinJ family antitoxin [Ellagibacter isourolithinifaciens]|uniref:type II toxin-antitoxin system RelB/DinJ family antitoxin n=2 Tax=Ellagibacter isourolithinifaciens TaxID=2137581 RepID=UPI003A9064F4
MYLHIQKLIGAFMASSTLTIRIDEDLKRDASEVADYYGLDLSSVTRAFYKQMVNTRRIPLTFAPEEPNAESLEAIREGDAFLSSGKEGRYDNGADLIAAAMR